MPAREPVVTPERVIPALRKTKGLVYLAAKELKCDPSGIYKLIKKSAAVRAVLEDTREHNLDVAESKLLAAIENGESWAITYYLNRIGRKRGYGDRQELTGLNGGAIETTIRVVYGSGGKAADDSDAAA